METERYLELCLRLGRHVDGLVDAYYGPAEIKERVDAEELRDPAALVQDAASLLAQAEDDWLGAQLLGLETVARKLAGEDVSYEDEVERCYGVRPEWVPEESFEAAHRELDEALPGRRLTRRALPGLARGRRPPGRCSRSRLQTG